MRKPVFILFERTTLILHARCESAAEKYWFMMPMRFDSSSGIVEKGFSGCGLFSGTFENFPYVVNPSMQHSQRQKIRATDTFHRCGLHRTSYKTPNQLINRKRKGYSTEQIKYTNQAEEALTFTPITLHNLNHLSQILNRGSNLYTSSKPWSKGQNRPWIYQSNSAASHGISSSSSSAHK